MGDMTLIDRGGKRRRPICRECRRLHRPADCPLRADEEAQWRAAGRQADLFAAWLRREREAKRAG